jgi:hypothetical protein
MRVRGFDLRTRPRLDDVENEMDRQERLEGERGKTEPCAQADSLHPSEHRAQRIMDLISPFPCRDSNPDRCCLQTSPRRTVYPFYVRAEGANSVNVPDVVVYLHAAPPGAGVVITPASKDAKGGKPAAPANFKPASGNGHDVTGEKAPDFVKPIAFNPDKLTFNFNMSGERSIAPQRVFSDGVFTWFDYGTKWDRDDLPAVYRVVDGVDTPVNTRIKGTMLVAEAAGAFTLRNGQRVVCVRPADWEPEGEYAPPAESSPSAAGSSPPRGYASHDP